MERVGKGSKNRRWGVTVTVPFPLGAALCGVLEQGHRLRQHGGAGQQVQGGGEGGVPAVVLRRRRAGYVDAERRGNAGSQSDPDIDRDPLGHLRRNLGHGLRCNLCHSLCRYRYRILCRDLSHDLCRALCCNLCRDRMAFSLPASPPCQSSRDVEA